MAPRSAGSPAEANNHDNTHNVTLAACIAGRAARPAMQAASVTLCVLSWLFASAGLPADRGAIALLGAYELATIVAVLQRTDDHRDLVPRLDHVARPALAPKVARRAALDIKFRHHTLRVGSIH